MNAQRPTSNVQRPETEPLPEALPFSAWIWKDTPGPGVPKREAKFASEVEARKWLCRRLGEWPAAFEYGIDGRESEALFLSDAIRARCGYEREGEFVPEMSERKVDDRVTGGQGDGVTENAAANVQRPTPNAERPESEGGAS